ncbi:FadR/GntR family transcriptional regulator [Umezawaea endophytica]|uniref:FadR family transcriptional regulator n=1 Tax=Umezawaea endophytica TaxID=1654476 RepID=A0A9X2VW64_9PSEU|nr:FadR/GntR family transcriptional regulator [Umezawaea endophytica]MCS7483963.1 FadR family transcriptional regulator [Umezawaea endophytica]
MADYQLRGIHGQTVETLARRILAGEIPEGATLDLLALREEFDVSLTALREALKVLSAKGIIDARQKRGTFVTPRSSWNVLDGDVMRWRSSGPVDLGLLENLDEVRSIVEPASARLAAERATAEDVAALEDALGRMASASDAAGAVEADLDFHRSLLSATHNPFLAQMERVISNGLAMRDKVVHDADPADDPVPSHRAVLEAIRGKDPAGAEVAMRALVDKASEDFRRVAG